MVMTQICLLRSISLVFAHTHTYINKPTHVHISIYIVEPLYSGHNWDQVNCPNYRGCPHFSGEFILQSTVWDIFKCPQYRGVFVSVSLE